jgi:hypothetical protein
MGRCSKCGAAAGLCENGTPLCFACLEELKRHESKPLAQSPHNGNFNQWSLNCARRGGYMLHRLSQATMVLASGDNHQAAIPIPAGKIVDVVGSTEDDRFVVISVNGERFLAFASDLVDGASQVKKVGA